MGEVGRRAERRGRYERLLLKIWVKEDEKERGSEKGRGKERERGFEE